MIYRFDLKQDTDEWKHARSAIPTSSRFDSILTPKKLALSESATGYMDFLLGEWMAGMPLDDFEPDRPKAKGWRERGKLLEPEAVRYYEMEKGFDAVPVGLVTTDDKMTASSPDRLIGEVGLLEQKCPALDTHVGYLRDPQSLLAEYRIQHQGQLWVCQDREWVDMQSYYPGFPSVIVRTYRDELVQKALSTHIPAFVEAMLRARERLTQEYGELRRERVTAAQRVEGSRAAFDSFMSGPIGGNV